jgi:hypothetical protein
MLQLTIVRGPTEQGRQIPMSTGATLIVGRGSDCDIQLNSPGVSKKHCRVTALPGSKIEVEDLGSSNGTFVNGLLIKRLLLKPGDSVVVHEYVLQVGITAPQLSAPIPFEAPNSYGAQPGLPSFAGNAAPAFDLNLSEAPQDPNAVLSSAKPETFAEKAKRWLDANVHPWADTLSSRFDVRALLVAFFLSWSVFIIFFTALPFSKRANTRVQNQSIEVAKLYARQLARVNQQAIIDQRYRDLIGVLDAKAGATPGLVSSMVLDVSKAQVLAPPELLGQSLPNPEAQKAITKDEPWSEVDNNGFAYVSAPIMIGTNEGNKTVATAFVVFDTLSAQFSTAALLDQAVTSLLYAMLASLLIFVFLYRWINGSIELVTQRIDDAMKQSDSEIASPVRWPALAQLCDQVSSALGRASGGGGAGAFAGNASGGSESEWATAAANASGSAAAAFDSGLVVTAWNAKMERVIGIRENMAMGAEIADASRDIAFENAIRTLATDAAASPWTAVTKELEFSGVNHVISMVSGNGAYLVNIYPVEG